MKSFQQRMLAIVVIMLVLSGCAVNPVTGKQDFVLMSEDEEIALGRKLHPQVLKETEAYEDAALQAYVQQVGERLARVSHRNNLIFRFTVLDSAEVNAFATPGGYIYITRGLMAYLNSEAELAAVLGHEIGHVTARHSVRQQSTATTTGLLAAVIGAATGVQGAGDLANVAGTALVRGYGREHELESDRLGAEYLARAGYDPRAMLEVIGVLKDQENFELQQAKEEGREPRIYHGLFSTHPDNDKRLQETVLAAQQFQDRNGEQTNREGFLSHLDGVAFGDSEREGVLRGDRFYHKPLNFGLQFPAGWKVKNLPGALVAQAPDGNGVLEVEVQDLNRRLTPREFMTQRLGIQEMRSEEALTVAGLPGYTAVVPANTRGGKRWVRVAVLQYHDQAFIFSGYYERDEPNQHAVLITARSFHALSVGEQALAAAQKLKLIRAGAGTRYAQLARTSPLQHHAEDQLRLLNDQYPQGEPAAGQWLKIVE